MTRITNFGRKRTYLEAGLENPGNALVGSQKDAQEATNVLDLTQAAPADASGSAEPPKKKKRIRKKKPKVKSTEPGSVSEDANGGAAEVGKTGGDDDGGAKEETGASKRALKKKKWKEMEKEKKKRRLLSSEMRRQKRIQERSVGTTCFACREKGHAARNCPSVKSNSGEEDAFQGKGKSLVGVCYRCGSTRHTLSRCRKQVDESNPLPFASCFVCNGKGHLASACPQNADKGIYPNGGCCKLCGEKTHLAKDCELRKKDNVVPLAVMGTGDRPGADEDDFHTFKRRKQEVEKESKASDNKRKSLQVRTGAHSVVVKSFGSTPKPAKKVVYF